MVSQSGSPSPARSRCPPSPASFPVTEHHFCTPLGCGESNPEYYFAPLIPNQNVLKQVFAPRNDSERTQKLAKISPNTRFP